VGIDRPDRLQTSCAIEVAAREVLREHILVDRSPEVIWDHLAKLEQWPSWAAHIARMEPTPPGELTPETQVVLHMKVGIRTKMAVTEYDAPRRWMWEGKSFGTITRFEHALEPVGDRSTRIWFTAWMGGPLSGPAGWGFGTMMRRYLARALPNLKAEIETTNGMG
jgi:polyketide cyclase/dehydrase/lipid transport protein